MARNEISDREELDRLKKAIKIADHLQAKGCWSALAQCGLGSDEVAVHARFVAGQALGIPVPSEETWSVVVELLVGREQAVDALRSKQDKAVAR